ncbi:multidrug transporter [Gallibacterium genomosp. 3]|uniref:Multidrug transporter n=1 Tax=Gallibacterium genomosp. 3 TaxID=505345 RepID=A0A1A7PSR5_9PAST|nr:SMR family transporter [Gallibacterium genomosp. 3]OBX04786.1 multidrug transporter [Gallibacterium genomosp. 3]
MNAWILLLLAISAEVLGTTMLKQSDGFTKLPSTFVGIISFGVALYLVSIVFKTLPVGITYAVWSGVGIVLTALIAFLIFGQKPDFAGFIGMAMIIGGVLVINLFSSTSGH